MKRAYLLIYDDEVGTRKEVRKFLDERPEVLHWRFDLPNTFYLVSELSAEALYGIFQNFNQERAAFSSVKSARTHKAGCPRGVGHS